jgi:hypothetical protein
MPARKFCICLVACAVGVIFYASQGYALPNSNKAGTFKQSQNPNPQGQMTGEQNSTDKEHSGQNDFDFEIGSWKIHLKKLLHPLTGSTTWVEFDGTSVTRKIWDGRSQIEQFETDSAVAGHIEGLTLRTYNPQTQQWRLYWANAKDGILDSPQIGEFKNGRGEFYAQDMLNGKSILIRFVWTNTTTNTPHFEQSFSEDGGKTWELNWITDQTRVPEESDKSAAASPVPQTGSGARATTAERDGQHDFDPLVGTWKYHLKKLQHPLTGSNTWVESDGTGVCYKLWEGRAQLDTFEAEGATGHIEGLTLRTYNPQSHQWRLYWANSKNGVIDPPQVGEFKNGRGEFLAQDTINDKTILIRYAWTNMTTDSPHFEQSFSEDGGKTWEANWITDQTRASDEADKGGR